MRRLRHISVRVVCTALVATALAVIGVQGPQAAGAEGSAEAATGSWFAPGPVFVQTARTAQAAQVARKAPPKPKLDNYAPKTGVKLSAPGKSPWGAATLQNHIIRSINSSPKGSTIRIISWNIRSDRAFDALIAAHRRGVSVRVLADRENANRKMELPNPGFFRMRKVLREGSVKRVADRKSFARVCASSCRGRKGIAHTKMFLFSQVGTTKDVVIYGSMNLTDIAVKAQWNDLMTVVGNKELYDFAVSRFKEMVPDRPIKNPWQFGEFDKYVFGVFPYIGVGATGDPILKILNEVTCTGATGGTGKNGRTVIRIGQTSASYSRGIKIATKLRELWDQGCDIKMLSALYGARLRTIFDKAGPRGPLPYRQVARDTDGDGLYDIYTHSKVMTISGVYGEETDASYTWNGSANWGSSVLQSDETFVRVDGPRVVSTYNTYIDYWFARFPKSAVPTFARAAVQAGTLNPYKNVEFH